MYGYYEDFVGRVDVFLNKEIIQDVSHISLLPYSYLVGEGCQGY